MKLLIDMGNSRLKWAVCQQLDDIQNIQALDNATVSVEKLIQAWKKLTMPERVVISQVSSNQLATSVTQAARQLWPNTRLIFATSQAYAYGVSNAYKQPEKLGVDRWLGMIAAYRRYPSGFCMVDCGTAITLDVVDSTGKHLGGLICPGLRLMSAALATGTANLDLTTTSHSPGLANHTAAAIYNGTLAAACGLIEDTTANSNAKDLTLVLTGGDADTIATHLHKPAIIEPTLVFYGLGMISSSS